MGRGGPAEPVLVEAAPSLDELVALAEGGAHAASDYLEDAVLAGVPTVGCRRVGGGLAGAPAESNVPAGAALAASLQPGAIVFEGSGSCIPPVEVDRTVCIVGPGEPTLWPSTGCCAPTWSSLTARPRRRPGRCASSCGPSPPSRCPRTPRWPSSPRAPPACEGVDASVASANLARRGALAADLDRAVAAGCDVWLTELKAAAIDTVVIRARAEGARVIFVRNRPLGDGLDAALVNLFEDARR